MFLLYLIKLPKLRFYWHRIFLWVLSWCTILYDTKINNHAKNIFNFFLLVYVGYKFKWLELRFSEYFLIRFESEYSISILSLFENVFKMVYIKIMEFVLWNLLKKVSNFFFFWIFPKKIYSFFNLREINRNYFIKLTNIESCRTNERV